MVFVGVPVPLRRSVADAKIGGICGGLAERAGIDPLLVRLAAVILAFCSGIGIVWYLSAWLLLPRGSAQPVVHRILPFTRNWPLSLWVVSGSLLTAGAVIIGSEISLGFVPAIVVAGLWFAGAIPRRPAATRTSPGPDQQQPVVIQTATGPWSPRNGWGQPVTISQAALFFPEPDPVGLYPLPQPRPTTLRERVTWSLVALLGIVLLILMALSERGWVVPTTAYLAAALMVAGLGLVFGAWFRRPRGLLAVTIVLALLSLAATIPQLLKTTTEEHISISAASLGRSYEVTMETTAIDMTDARFSAPGQITINVWAGQALLVLPEDGNTTVRWEIRSGRVVDPDLVVYEAGTGSYRYQPAPLRPPVTVSVVLVDSSLTVVRP